MGEQLPRFDVRDIPFSRRGAWVCLSPVVGLGRVAEEIHLVSHRALMHAVLALVPVRDGAAAACEVRADAAVLEWRSGEARIQAVFLEGDAIRIRGRGLGMRMEDAAGALTPFTGTYLYRDPVDGSYVFTSYETGMRYRVTSVTGSVTAEGCGALGAAQRSAELGGDEWEVIVEEATEGSAPTPAVGTFDEAVARVRDEFTSYLDAVAPWRTSSTSAAGLAAYVLWSATVRPGGFLRRESVLMSKNWMDKVWSWDHCFNALALAPGFADEALDQFLVPFDHQDEGGALPDSVTGSEVLRNFVKPPIHGWAFARLRASINRDLSAGELAEVYDRLAAWSRFWLTRRRQPGRALAHYHHGNDSGWDNSTMFDRDRIVEAPDLAAFLAVQLDELAALSDELGRGEGAHWRSLRDEVTEALLTDLSDDEGFFAVAAESRSRSLRTSLLTTLPVVAADHLPADVLGRLADEVSRHLTAWGLATELPSSPHYEADGYWRGPIWAPSTLLIEDGLRRGGFEQLADVVSHRFRELCERHGFAENFDALTGHGLRDRAYTWTASVYLVLAREAVAREKDLLQDSVGVPAG